MSSKDDKVITDLQEQLKEAKKVINELEHDELTGLFTRQAFIHNAERILNENPDKQYGVVALDLDNFKSANSLYGEDKCNEFLSVTARRLSAILPDFLIGRFGGDQFVIFFEVGTEKQFAGLLSDYDEIILKNSPIPNQNLKIGIYNPIDRNIIFVRCCDRAFLAIKTIKGVYGKNIAIYEDSLHQQLIDEQKIIESMENGLLNQEFQVYYQPKHDTITGKIAGAEALVRWIHPVYGFMSPGQFIPLFERNGFITKLDSYILDRVCQDIKRWQAEGKSVVPVSVNISRRDFFEEGKMEMYFKQIEEYGINHQLIHVEVTESLYSENTDLIITQVKEFQDLGFMIEMDDFGAGYSSLGLLSTFPLDIIKLDISFVKNIEVNEIVIENMIKMGHRMGLVIVAEGVETEAQFKILKGLGCDLIQGFYFSKPLPVGEFEDYVSKIQIPEKISERKYSKISSNHVSEDLLMAATEVAEGLPGGFFSYHNDENLEIISFNHLMMEFFECETPEEFREYTGNSFKGIVYKEDYDDIEKILNQCKLENQEFDYLEYRILTKSGNIKYVRDYGRRLKTERYGEIFYVFVVDFTEEKLREEKNIQEEKVKYDLEHRVELEKQINTAKNIFITSVSTSILTQVKNIVDYSNEIKKNISDIEKVHKIIEKQKDAEEQMLGVVNNLQELSLLETDDIELKEVPLDLTGATERAYEQIRKTAEEKHLHVEYTENIKNPYIYQDLMHTAEVVLNILFNAVKYTPEGGTVKFSINQYDGKNPDECNIEFICEDTGIGISDEYMPDIYKAFSREKNEVNNKISSAGMGLHIASRLMQLMNGTIEIESKKGKGCKVRTYQPHRLAKKEDVSSESSYLTENVRI